MRRSLIVGLLIVLLLSTQTVYSQRSQPILYFIGVWKVSESSYPIGVYWFENETDTCYILYGNNRSGISCSPKRPHDVEEK